VLIFLSTWMRACQVNVNWNFGQADRTIPARGVTLYAVITPCPFQILRVRGMFFLLLKRASVGANRPPHTLNHAIAPH
jgi:hypothetical protein